MEAAVVSAALGAGGLLVRKLGKLVTDNYTSLGGVRSEMRELKDELESLNACLRDLDSRDDDDDRSELTRVWMNQVREVGYDADDCIDIFCHHLMTETNYDPGDSRYGGQLAKHMHKIANLIRSLGIRNELATNIKSLKSRAQKVSERRMRYITADKPNPSRANSSPDNGEPGSSNHHEDTQQGSVGQEADEISLVGQLSDDAEDLRVISIVGCAGIGKTRLARTVFTSPKLNEVEHRAFVAVSRNYEPLSLLKSILRKLVPIPLKDGHMGEDPLQGIESWRTKSDVIQNYKHHLANKRYLVILDDVWSLEPWEYLKEAFTNDKRRSRIVVTTRSEKIAKSFSTSQEHLFEMKKLDQENSKKLLHKTVFGQENIPNEYKHLEAVCEEILKKCDGLPLAIVSTGGMLAKRVDEPAATLEKVIVKRLSSELQKDGQLHRMRRIVSLSYNELPYHMKACFLYLTVFPEDHEIRRGPLVRRWIAEGFVNAANGLSMEEIAHSFIDEFVSRNIVTVGQLTSSGGSCRSFMVHDIMLDIITSKAIQENFVSFLGNPQQSTAERDNSRRLSVQPGQREKYLFTASSLPRVRSLTILGGTEKPVEKIAFAELTLLRVLDLEGCQWLNNKDLNGICKLSLLRYLSLRRTSISKLPRKLGRLKRLVTLDVRQTKIQDLPKSVKQLQCLQHVMAGAYVHFTRGHSVKHFAYEEAVKMPRGLSKMKSLQRISFMDVERSGLETLKEVAKLSKLTRLCAMQKNPDGKWGNFGESLSKLSTSLRYLSIMQHEGDCKNLGQLGFLRNIEPPPLNLESLHLVGGLGRLPSWFEDLKSLASLSLRHTSSGNILRVLGNLPSLVSLKLYSGAYLGPELCFESGQFPVLKQLVVDNLPHLTKLSFVNGAPKNLERLTLYLPRGSADTVLGIGKLEKLTTIEFFGINNDKMMERVEDEAGNHRNKPLVTREDRPPFCS